MAGTSQGQGTRPRRHRLERRDWSFVGAMGMGQLIAMGAINASLPAFLPAIEAELGWTRVAVTGAFTVAQLITAFAALPVGMLIERRGPKAVMVVSSLLAGGVFALLAVAPDQLVYYILWSIIGAASAACMMEPAMAVVAGQLGRDKFQMGATGVTLLTGLASSTFVPVGYFLVTSYGLKASWIILGLVSALVPAAIYATIVSRSKVATPPSLRGPKTPSALRQAMRRRQFWTIAVSMSALSFAWSALSFHLLPLMLENGVPAPLALLTLAIVGPLQIVTRLLLVLVGASWPASLLGRVMFGALFGALGLAMVIHSAPALLVPFALCYGFAGGLQIVVRSTIVAELFTLDGFPTINGALAMPMNAARAVAPVTAAAIWQAAGGYETVLWTLVVLSLLALATLLLSGPGRLFERPPA